MAKTLEMAVQLSCVMNGNFDDRFTKAAKQIDNFKSKIEGLKSLDAVATSYQKLSDRINSNNATIEQNKKQLTLISTAYSTLKQRQQQLQKLQDALPARKRNTSEYAAELKKLTQEMTTLGREQSKLEAQNKKLGSQVKTDQEKFSQMGESLRKAGIDTNNLARSQDYLQRELRETQQAQDNLVQAQSRLQAARQKLNWQNITGDLVAATAKFKALEKPIKVSMDFSSAMASLNAVARLSKEEFAELEKLALRLGADTQFSNTQAAQTMEVLARAGWQVKDIQAGIPSVLSMAAAEGLELSEAADAITRILGGMNMKSSQAGELADILAFTSRKSNTNIRGLVETMKPAAPVVSTIGVSASQLASMLGVMANHGFNNSDAGTALASTVFRLAKGPKEVRAALAELGVAIQTRDGHFREIPDILKEIYAKTQKMGEAPRTEMMAKIFGLNHGKAITALLQGAAAGEIDTFERQFANGEHIGQAAESARIRNDTLSGDLTRLSSALEGFLTRFGKPLEELLRPIVDTLTQILSWINRFADNNPTMFKAAAVAAGGVMTYSAGKTVWNIGKNITEFLSARRALTAAQAAAQAAGAGTAGQALTSAAAGAGAEIAGAGATAGSALTGAGTSAGAAVTAAGASAGASLLAGASVIGLMVGAVYAQYKMWQNMTPEQRRARQEEIMNSEGATRRTREISPNAQRMRGGRNRGGFTPHATGGIFTTPHLGLVAEAGAEAIIPLTDKSRGTGLLIQAAGKLGMLQNNKNFVDSHDKKISQIKNLTRAINNSSNIINNNFYQEGAEILNGTRNSDLPDIINSPANHNNLQHFAPVINISVNANESQSRDNYSLSELIAEKVRSVLDEMNNNFARLEYA